mgnify:CR=1 FL=1
MLQFAFVATMVASNDQTKTGAFVYAKATQVSHTLKGVIDAAYKDAYVQGTAILSEMRAGNKKQMCYICAKYTIGLMSWIVDVVKQQIKPHLPNKIRVCSGLIQGAGGKEGVITGETTVAAATAQPPTGTIVRITPPVEICTTTNDTTTTAAMSIQEVAARNLELL